MTEKKDSPLINYMINNPEAFAQNLSRIMQESGKALSAYLEPREKGENKSDFTSELSEVVKTLGQVGEYWGHRSQGAPWTLRAVCGPTICRPGIPHCIGWPGEPSASPTAGEPDPADKRFKESGVAEQRIF